MAMSADTGAEGRMAALKFAAEDGDSESMFLLGVAYAQGQGVEKNETIAARWFHEAARHGHARARTSMGFLYSTGRGVRRDLILAFVFFTQAVALGDKLAVDMLARLQDNMTPAQIKEASRRVERQAGG